MVHDLRAARAARADYPDLLFVHRETAERGATFFGEHAPDAAAVADPEGGLFDGFGIARDRWGQMLGWKNFRLGFRAWRQGHRVGKPGEDVTRMPGLFLVRAGKVLWEHSFDAVGDHPDFAAIGEGQPTRS